MSELEQAQRRQTEADKVAAAKLMRWSPVRPEKSHRLMNGLSGEQFCPHVLAGNGHPLQEFIDNIGEETESLAKWRTEPYRHHRFAPEQIDDGEWCLCGNVQDNPCHTLCAEAKGAL